MTEPASLYVVCETHAAVTTHLRRLEGWPVRYGGHYNGPTTLCGHRLGGWDTRIPVPHVRCRVCRNAAGLSESLP
jgi:hypothetical protein